MILPFNFDTSSMKNLIFLIAISSILFSSCSLSPCGFSKDQFVQKHQDLVNEAKKNKKRWTDIDWESRDENMKKMVEDCYENYEEEMSGKEIGKFWAGTTAYYFNRHGKNFIRELKRSEKDISKAIEEGLGSLDENKGELLKEWLKENVGGDIKESMNELGDDIKDLGKEIEQWLNE